MGFLLGRISAIREAPDDEGRSLIAISEFARISVPGAWKHWRNPVRYGSLADWGVNPEDLQWHPVPGGRALPPQTTRAHEPTPSEASRC